MLQFETFEQGRCGCNETNKPQGVAAIGPGCRRIRINYLVIGHSCPARWGEQSYLAGALVPDWTRTHRGFCPFCGPVGFLSG